MAVDKLVDSGQLDSDLTSVANAIRSKGGTSAQLAFPNGFVSAVNALPVPVTPTIQSLTVTPTTSQQTFDSSSVDGYKPVTVNAMPSGTAGTPTATKGAVISHSVSVTPSVTNTTGYITGSTKTGTAVTVSASELVSGSETKTANGTYDVTNLAELVVNVSGGGGGLVYETGTYTPAANIARPNISFSNSHTELPILIMMVDVSGEYSTYANYCFTLSNMYTFKGEPIPSSSEPNRRYAYASYLYRGSGNPSLATSAIISTGSASSSDLGYWVTTTDFYPSSNSTSRYWITGRTYKWIAVWKPTS